MRDTANTEVASYVASVRDVSSLVAQCALAAANWTSLYREPGQSISDVDGRLGLESDVVDPLLTAHRAAKFYLISAGDCVDSMSKLLPTDHPNLVGAAALARSAAEHASRSMYLSDPTISYQARMLRISLLISSSLREYKSSHDVGATNLIDTWNRWGARTGCMFKGVPKQTLPNATGLIQRYFAGEGTRSYEELSRPTHGNATWLVITVIAEQKQTAAARIMLMRNAMFATRCVVAATVNLANLWGLDLDRVLNAVAERGGFDASVKWGDLANVVHSVSQVVGSFDERQFIDTTPDEQPRR